MNTDRLTINSLNSDDWEFVKSLVNSDGWLKYIGDRKIDDRKSALAYIKNLNRLETDQGHTLWCIRLKESGRAIGLCGLLKREYLDANDIGYAILPEYEGLGFVKEACASVLKWATDQGENKIYAISQLDNSRSIGLLQNLGFRHVQNREEEVDSVPLGVYLRAL